MLPTIRQSKSCGTRRARRPQLRRPTAVAPQHRLGSATTRGGHVLSRADENTYLGHYERKIKQSFDDIVPTLKRISAIQHEPDFEGHAQKIARDSLGFPMPEDVLKNAWVDQLDMRRLFAWCVFQVYVRFCDDFYSTAPTGAAEELAGFLQSCGFHSLDISPCADGRLAHVVRYVLRLSPRAVRRKSYAGALFDVEDSVQKWVQTELRRYREGKPNAADSATRYLKVVVYHFSSSDPEHQGCAAHGSNTEKAAQAGLEKLVSFREAIENGFCCGASIDLLLIGLDTDTDAIRIHVPNAAGEIVLERFIESAELYSKTFDMGRDQALKTIDTAIRVVEPDVADGMCRLVAKLIENNISQIDYVKENYGKTYPDIGHAERFVGAGIGFEDIQIRNLMYFSYLDTVEEGAADLDVGIKIFTGLNVKHGLPVPVVVRFDYHGHIPGGQQRAAQRCERVANALAQRYSSLYEKGLLHIMQVVRDCDSNESLQVLMCTAEQDEAGGH